VSRLLAALCLLALPLPALAQAPLAANDVVATTAGTPIDVDVLANDSDPDGDPVDLTAVDAPGHGTATFAGAIVTYTPAAGFTGIDHFLYTISDGSNTARAAVSVYVDVPLPPPPVLTLTPSFLDFGEVPIEKTRDLVLTVTNNTAAPIELANFIPVDQGTPTPFDATDYLAPDGCHLILARTLDPGESCIQIVRFYSVVGADAVSPTQMRLLDGTTFDTIATVPLFAAVGPPDTGLNSSPSAVDDLAGVAPGFTHTLEATRNDSDPDHDRLRIASVSDPLHGTAAVISCPANPNTDCIQYVPDAGYIGTDAFLYAVSDGRGGTATATYHLAVGNLVPNVAAITPDRGPTSGGQAVRITGSNFVFRSDAAFLCLGVGTLPLTITSLTDTEILATTPASLPGVCDLRVVTRFGRTGQLANAYTYEGSAPVDTDGDGVLDATDNCPLTPNPSQANADGDGQGDACDPDDDNDGSADVSDNCPLHANADQADTDADGLGNVCDTDDDNDGQSDADEVACGSNPLSAASTAPDGDRDGRPDCVDPDDDNDGVADGSDNCPQVANASQADADHDGVGDACDPTTLPDRTIVFSRATGSSYRIFKMRADGSNVTQLTSGDSFSADRTPALSPDGRYVLFARWGVQGSAVYRIDVDGGNLVRLTGAGFGLDWDPTWSPDGTQIAYSCVAYVCVMNADGSNMRRLAWHGIASPGPAWSPDGTKIAFASFRFGNAFLGNAEILVMNADGSGLTRLTTNSAADVGPTWSPDSARIAFATLRHGNYEIYSMNAADGTGLMRLTNRAGYDGEPAWGANGQIAFTSVLGSTGTYLRKINADGSGVTALAAGIEPHW